MKQTATESRCGACYGVKRSCCPCRLVVLLVACLVLWPQPSLVAQIGSRENPLDAVDAGSFAVEQPQGGVGLLELNNPLERELLQGETHLYHIQVGAGQYVRVAVERWGAELRLVLRDRKGLIRADFTCRSDSPVPVSLIAENPGIFLLEFHAQDPSPSPARYRVEVEELRPASSRDRGRLVAEKAFFEGSRLRAMEREASSRRAIREFEAARNAWQAAGDQRGEVIALRAIAEVYEGFGETQKALSYYDQALSLSRRAKNVRGEGETLAALAYLQFFLGDTQRAFDNAAAALALSQAAGNRRGAARALSVMGETYYGFGDIAKAVQIQEQALALWRAVNDLRGEAQSLMYLG